jgi:hypothetical protein
MIRAYAFASGHIGFGRNIPAGATVIARGAAEKLKPFIRQNARITSPPAPIRGIPDAQWLLVPGMPEAESKLGAVKAFENWTRWIATKAPRDVRVLPR